MAQGIYVGLPEYPYTTEIKFPFHFIQKTDGSLSVRDDGSEYDIRTCRFEWNTHITIASRWITFLKDENRYNSFQITIDSDTDFYPFGPDFLVNQTYDVKLLDFINHGQQDIPFKYHKFNVELQLILPPIKNVPTSLPLCSEPGTLTLGDIEKIRFPKDHFKPEISYSFRNVTTRNGNIYQIQTGNNSDYHDTVLTVIASKEKAAMLIDYITNTIRTNNFNLVVPTNSYPFGYELGDNKTFICKLNQSSLIIRHNKFNEFQFDLKIRRVI